MPGRPSRRVLIAVGAVLLVVALGAAAWYLVPRQLARVRATEAVRAYNDGLIAALAELDPERVSPYATDAQLSTVTTYITYLWGTGVYMEATLLALEPVSVESQGTGYVAVMDEEWRFQKRDRSTRQTVGGGERSKQRVRYVLVPSGDALVVSELEVLEER